MGSIKMFDLPSQVNKRKKYFKELYSKNIGFFYYCENWFYFANKQAMASCPGRVLYGNFLGDIAESYSPDDKKGDFVGHFKSQNIEKIEELCNHNIDQKVWINLKDGINLAYLMIVDMVDGEREVGVVIKNNRHSLDLPFSREGNYSYEKAANEVGSLPYIVENDLILHMFKDEDLELMGLEKPSSKDYGEDINL